MTRSLLARAPFALAFLALAACGGGDDGGTQPPPANRAPEVSILLDHDQRAFYGGEVVVFTGTALDDDDDPLTLEWSATGGSFDATDGTQAQWTAPSTPGSYEIRFSASDGEETTTDTQSWTVGTLVSAGDLDAGASWGAAASPYIMATDVTLPAGQTLTMAAGTELQIRPRSLLGGTLEKYQLFVRGTLLAQGTGSGFDQRVWVRGGRVLQPASTTQHRGLAFQVAGEGTLVELRVEEGDPGVSATGSGTVVLNSSRVRRCGTGVRATGGGTLRVRNTVIDDCLGIGAIASDATLEMDLCRLEGNGAFALQLTSTGGTTTAVVDSCSLDGRDADVPPLRVDGGSGQSSLTMRASNVFLADPLSDDFLQVPNCFTVALMVTRNYWGFPAATPAELRARIDGSVPSSGCGTVDEDPGQPFVQSAFGDHWTLANDDWTNSPVVLTGLP